MIPQPNPQPWPGLCQEGNIDLLPGITTAAMTCTLSGSYTATCDTATLGPQTCVTTYSLSDSASFSRVDANAVTPPNTSPNWEVGPPAGDFILYGVGCCDAAGPVMEAGEAAGTASGTYSYGDGCYSPGTDIHEEGSGSFNTSGFTFGISSVQMGTEGWQVQLSVGYDATEGRGGFSVEVNATSDWINLSDLAGAHTFTITDGVPPQGGFPCNPATGSSTCTITLTFS